MRGRTLRFRVLNTFGGETQFHADRAPAVEQPASLTEHPQRRAGRGSIVLRPAGDAERSLSSTAARSEPMFGDCLGGADQSQHGPAVLIQCRYVEFDTRLIGLAAR